VAFAPTLRAAVLLGIGVLWIVPAWTDPRAIVLMGVWNVIVIAAMLFDFRRLPGPADLIVTRRWGGALTIGAPVTVSLAIENRGPIPIVARLTDYAAPALRRDLPVVEMRVPARRSAEGTYHASPRERGDIASGNVLVEWHSAWGLIDRWAQAPLEQTVRVYPDLREGRRHTMYLIRSRQVALEKRRARRAGGGREFDRLRDYRPGDERRDVSWRVSARRGRLISKVYQPERSQTVWLLVDAGRLLRARTGDQTLLDRATTAALALAQVAMASGDNVGLVAYGRKVQHRLAPARGPAHMRSLTEALAVLRSEPAEANHAAAAAALAAGQKRRALIIWLTEVAETAGVPDVIEFATSLVPRHVLLFATMRQPDMATVTAARPANATEMYRVLAAQEAADRRETLLRGLRQRGALVVEASPDALASGLVDRYLEVKERGVI